MSRKPPTKRADTMAVSNDVVASKRLSDDANAQSYLTSLTRTVKNERRRTRAFITANGGLHGKQSVARLLQASHRLPPRKRLRDSEDEEETAAVKDKEPSLVPEKSNEVQEEPPLSKKARMSISDANSVPIIVNPELISHSGSARSLLTAAAAAPNDSRFDSTCNNVNGSTFHPQVSKDTSMNTTMGTTRNNNGGGTRSFADPQPGGVSCVDRARLQVQATTTGQLSDSDVRAIFQSIHHQRPPPPHLQFQVVPVGQRGSRVSPPSYDFEDGLYILMKPQKKTARPSEQPEVPPYFLADYVMHEKPPATCPWRINGGPRFPRPTDIQKRYCIPEGDPSSLKAGTLWTMYSSDGEENLEYRLLHVYCSAKRVANKKAACVVLKNLFRLPDNRPQSATTLPTAVPELTQDVNGSHQDPHAMASGPSSVNEEAADAMLALAVDYRPRSAPSLPAAVPELTQNDNGSHQELHAMDSLPRSVNEEAADAMLALAVDYRPGSATTLPTAVPELTQDVNGSHQDPHAMDSLPRSAPTLPTTSSGGNMNEKASHGPELVTQEAFTRHFLNLAPGLDCKDDDDKAGLDSDDKIESVSSDSLSGDARALAALRMPPPHSQHIQPQLHGASLNANTTSYQYDPNLAHSTPDACPKAVSMTNCGVTLPQAMKMPPPDHSQKTQTQSTEEVAWGYVYHPLPNEEAAWDYLLAPSQPPPNRSQQTQFVMLSNKVANSYFGWTPSQLPNPSGSHGGSVPHEHGLPKQDGYLPDKALGHASRRFPSASKDDDDYHSYKPPEDGASFRAPAATEDDDVSYKSADDEASLDSNLGRSSHCSPAASKDDSYKPPDDDASFRAPAAKDDDDSYKSAEDEASLDRNLGRSSRRAPAASKDHPQDDKTSLDGDLGLSSRRSPAVTKDDGDSYQAQDDEAILGSNLNRSSRCSPAASQDDDVSYMPPDDEASLDSNLGRSSRCSPAASNDDNDSPFDSTCNDVNGSTLSLRDLMNSTMNATPSTTESARNNNYNLDQSFLDPLQWGEEVRDELCWTDPVFARPPLPTSSPPPPQQGVNTRRLSDSDVRAIFKSIHHECPPPPHLHFQVVPVGPGGYRVSPPSYEFEDGLYILVKLQKTKARPSEQPKVPFHLADYVMHEKPPATCLWRTSGPQFPRPTDFQQRYCSPEGVPEYSSRKAGTLWTMYSSDGEENLEYRLLHVYCSVVKSAAAKPKNLSRLPDNRPQSAPTLPAPVGPGATHNTTDGGAFESISVTENGGLLLKSATGVPLALIDSDTTNLSKLFKDHNVKVTNLAEGHNAINTLVSLATAAPIEAEVTSLTTTTAAVNTLDSSATAAPVEAEGTSLTTTTAALNTLDSSATAAPVETNRLKSEDWTEEEDELLRIAVSKSTRPYNWRRIAREQFQGSTRTATQMKNRFLKVLDPGLKRTPWTDEEDAILRKQKQVGLSFNEMAKHKLPGRLAEDIEDRWVTHLAPRVKKFVPWTEEEDEILYKAQARLGNDFVEISELLPGRTAGAVQVRWYGHRGRLKQLFKASKDLDEADTSD